MNILESPCTLPQNTTIKNHSKNPEWNEVFNFDLPQKGQNPINFEIKLKHTNVVRNRTVAKIEYIIPDLEEGKPSDHTFTFDNGSKVFVTFTLINRGKQRDEVDMETKPDKVDFEPNLKNACDSLSIEALKIVEEISKTKSHNASNGHLETKENSTDLTNEKMEMEIMNTNNCEKKLERNPSSSSSEIGAEKSIRTCCNNPECSHIAPSQWWKTTTKVMSSQRSKRSDSSIWDTDEIFDMFQMFK
ncbi:unnamed protein product, partial [Meganyctiphanes norvegica]